MSLTFDEATFGALNAEGYDEGILPDTLEDSVALISGLAGQGRVLEFAIGTGRVALPLAARGHVVAGIEGAPEMVEKLRAKPGGEALEVLVGDMAEARVPGEFSHAFLVFNTLFNLTTQEAQVRLFANAARHLEPGGSFLVEAFVPDLAGFTNGQRVSTKAMDMESAMIEAATWDAVNQRLDMQRIHISAEGNRLVPLVMRVAAPPEIDLMARLAGLMLEHRWGGWAREPFTADSRMHVSLYRKPAA
ncbi:methyltransferase domain-containing protein [Oceanicola sp. D3]|uniref:class I SAM-dependent DNA methyltransferase n=1 Tax=Oceanicola sp. D3 TaxID=2587163 RepID=UPI0011231E98|nr:class I SAM-dependent methyltransferase [Oceanicola sp. D3]QDC08713.1 methyltransferase domain-containing protein [Oceanicola sp. D3]